MTFKATLARSRGITREEDSIQVRNVSLLESAKVFRRLTDPDQLIEWEIVLESCKSIHLVFHVTV